MFISHGARLRLYLRNLRSLWSLCGSCSLGYRKIISKDVHSLHQFKEKRPIRKIKGSAKKSVKEDVEPQVYTRDTIRNISNILRYSTWDSAQEKLENLSIKWDSYTINQVLKAHPPMERAWLFFNWAAQLKRFKHDQFTYTTMLDIFGEARRISSMNYVFQQMQEKGIKIDVVTYTSLLHWMSRDGDVDGSVEIWKEMKAKGCRPTVVSYTAYMKVLFDHDRVKEATEVYKEMILSGCAPNCYTYTVLMENLADSGYKAELGCEAFFANGLSRLSPSQFTPRFLNFPFGVLRLQIMDSNLMLLISGKLNEVLEIFSKMQEAGVQPDKAACNILVEKCCMAGETWAMMRILHYMKEKSLVLRHSVYLKALKTLRIAGESNALLRQVNPQFSIKCITTDDTEDFYATVPDSHSLDQGLVLNYLNRNNFVAVDHLLADMMNKNIQLHSEVISTIIEVHSAHCRPNGALLAFDYSVKMGILVERTAYLSLIGVFIRTNSFPKVVEIVEEMARAGLSLGTHLSALLIYRLGCAKELVSAEKVFNLLPDEHKRTAAYTALIDAYFSSGEADKGLATYKTMTMEGIPAALGTYNVLFAGLERSGRVSDLEYYRKEKKSLQAAGLSQLRVSMEERVCNLLFAEDVTS
ncbi:hypothetical protein RJ639_019279 [Escallonia herrerae]|uniref:Pentatricopeptide repeat-containing protein n=1 Tax=Escallonia herrerae TaxID=1293975 RepID=A0AA88V7H5_9ASTE|nr:hypothetical protein RJ639_019279 [Escallonia herrerae]